MGNLPASMASPPTSRPPDNNKTPGPPALLRSLSDSGARPEEFSPPRLQRIFSARLDPTEISPFSVLSFARRDFVLGLLFRSLDGEQKNFLSRAFLHRWAAGLEKIPEALKGKLEEIREILDHDEDSQCSAVEFKAAFYPLSDSEVFHFCVFLLRPEAAEESLRPELWESLEEKLNPQSKTKDFLLSLLFRSAAVEFSLENSFCFVFPLDALARWPGEEKKPEIENSMKICMKQAEKLASVRSSELGNFPGLLEEDFLSIFSLLDFPAVEGLVGHRLAREKNEEKPNAREFHERRHKLQSAAFSIPQHGEQQLRLVKGSSELRDFLDQNSSQKLSQREQSNSEDGKISPLKPSAVRHLRLTTFGQIMIQHDLREFPRGRASLEEMKNLLTGEIVFSELETAILVEGAEPLRQGVFQHVAPPAVLDCLKGLNVNVLACSNNHAGDLGAKGIRAIMEQVEKRGIFYAGIGESLTQAAQPRVFEVSHLNPAFPDPQAIALVAFASKIPAGYEAADEPPSPGVNHLAMVDLKKQILNEADVRRILSSISKARERCSVVLAYHHNHYWEAAVNEMGKFGSWRRDWAHQCIRAGATVFVAHGEPRLSGIELFRGCPIFYCLGNFIFQTRTDLGFYSQEVWESCIVQLDYFEDSQSLEKIAPKRAQHLIKGQANNRQGEEEKIARNGEFPHDGVAEEFTGKSSAPAPSTYFSIKLIPIELNEAGDEEAFMQTRGLPRLASPERAKAILARIQALSAEFGTRIEVDQANQQKILGWVLPEEKILNTRNDQLG